MNRKRDILILVFVAAVILGGGGSAKADFTFGTPTNLGPPVNSSADEVCPSISADGLSLFFVSDRPGGYGSDDIWVTTRDTIDDEWGTPMNLGPTVNSAYNEWYPSISADGLSLYFPSNRPGGSGEHDLYVTTRASVSGDWEPPVNLGPTVNSSSRDTGPSISANGLVLFFNSNQPGGYGSWDLYVTTRATIDDAWGTPVNLGSTVNSSACDAGPSISADGRSLFFHSYRSARWELWVTTRETVSDPWRTPVNLGPTVNSSATEGRPSISADGRTLFFQSSRSGGSGPQDLWQVSILPVVDFNGDGIVNASDICIMVDNWGENYPLCDIGPTPFGDGIVDVQDLIVLAEYLFKEPTDPTLIAHWALDETEGDIAHDSAGNSDGTLNGSPLWQPTAGMVDGALQFDGVDDYVSTDHILDPAEGAFSVVGWVKGGAPGQLIISQQNGANWLLTDAQAGALMTELKGSGRTGGPLLSQTVVTDGDWHRIGLVWDGSYRTLYADGTDVAKDTEPQAYLEAAYGGLYFGAGSTLEAASFWSGLIDDVRIYDRAITP